MNAIDQIELELHYLQHEDSKSRANIRANTIRNLICQVRETLEALEVKQKIWDQKAESQEVQPEQEHSTPHNDQKLQEKEQSQRTRSPSDISMSFISRQLGGAFLYTIRCPENSRDEAKALIRQLNEGHVVTYPTTWKVQVIDLC
jgi:DNA polymerase II large subunit